MYRVLNSWRINACWNKTRLRGLAAACASPGPVRASCPRGSRLWASSSPDLQNVKMSPGPAFFVLLFFKLGALRRCTAAYFYTECFYVAPTVRSHIISLSGKGVRWNLRMMGGSWQIGGRTGLHRDGTKQMRAEFYLWIAQGRGPRVEELDERSEMSGELGSWGVLEEQKSKTLWSSRATRQDREAEGG